MYYRLLCWVTMITVLTGCTLVGNTPSDFISFRVTKPNQITTQSLHIDANGYVVRTIDRRTDEFVLSKTDFTSLLNQLDTLAFERFPQPVDTDLAQETYYTITYQDQHATILDNATPASAVPLMITFKRIMSVTISQ